MAGELGRTWWPAGIALALAIGVSGCFEQSADMGKYRGFMLPATERAPRDGGVKVTFLGVTTLLFDDGESQFMVDGFFSRHPFPKVATCRISTDRKAVETALRRAKADRVKAIFVTHSHYDHAFDSAFVAEKTGATLHGSPSTLNIAKGWPGPVTTEPFESGKEVAVGDFKVVVRESRHSPPSFFNNDLGKTIGRPLRQPARFSDYTEGGTYDLLIKHRGRSILVKPSTHWLGEGRQEVEADVLFLSVARLAKEDEDFRETFYAETVGKVRPKLVVPMHWDSFFEPLSENLSATYKLGDDVKGAFDFLSARLRTDKIRFGLMQGYQSVTLFEND